MRSKLIAVSVFQSLGIRDRQTDTAKEREGERKNHKKGRDREKDKKIVREPDSSLQICFKILSREFRSPQRQWLIKFINPAIFTGQGKE